MSWLQSCGHGDLTLLRLCGRAASILFVQILLTGWSESKRWADFANPGSQADGSFLGVTDDFKGMANGYPGGKFFDPLGLSRGSESQLRRYQDSEIKNGARLP